MTLDKPERGAGRIEMTTTCGGTCATEKAVPVSQLADGDDVHWARATVESKRRLHGRILAIAPLRRSFGRHKCAGRQTRAETQPNNWPLFGLESQKQTYNWIVHFADDAALMECRAVSPRDNPARRIRLYENESSQSAALTCAFLCVAPARGGRGSHARRPLGRDVDRCGKWPAKSSAPGRRGR